MNPSQEVRRQERQWAAYDRMHSNRTPLPSAWWCAVFIFALVISTLWVASLPIPESIKPPAYSAGY